VALFGTQLVATGGTGPGTGPSVANHSHHSAERLDTFGSSFFHPFDIAGEIIIRVAATMILETRRGGAVSLVSVFLSS
jgi:hypothetical protein